MNHPKSSLVPASLETEAKPQAIAVSSETCLMRVRRPDGSEKLIRFPAEHLQRVMDLAAGEFGDPSIIHVGPELPKE